MLPAGLLVCCLHVCGAVSSSHHEALVNRITDMSGLDVADPLSACVAGEQQERVERRSS